MTYGQVKTLVLKLLNQHSVAGTLVENSYNNQQDYINRIGALINDATMEIATSVRKIPEVLRLEDLDAEDLGETLRYEMPANFYQLVSGDTAVTCRGAVVPTNQYSVQGQRYLLLRKNEVDADQVSVTYYRYPELLPDNPSDSDQLDNTPDTHQAIAYYVASMLVAQDDAFLCALLNNKYEDKLARLSPGVTMEVRPIEDAYSFFD